MDNKLTKEEVKHIAQLANLTIEEEEIAKFQIQLSSILDYIEKLQKLDANDVSQTNQVTGLKNVTEEDLAVQSVVDNNGKFYESKQLHNNKS